MAAGPLGSLCGLVFFLLRNDQRERKQIIRHRLPVASDAFQVETSGSAVIDRLAILGSSS